ncbi:uncharacterized protein LOC113299371 [Papaver somniferum]|uniref:uncharacterized protein LOC113299371 n=1 Tax=Papaver somniferum TaxID=3469 RepID=UPI000E7048A0|nr:uncharacterized protein LOC113299371 [Papaver somniferum]
MNVLPRIQFFTWKMKENILPFNGCLSVFINYIDPICIVCRNNIETGEHAFMQCSFARAVWAQCYLNLDNATYGDKGETIDRRTRGATTLGKEAGDCLAARDALEWASPLKCKKFNLLGTYYHITSTLKGGSRKTSWKTNSKVDQLLLKINSFEKVNCKVINPKNFLNLQNLAKMGSSTQSHLMWEANDIATYCQ